MLSAASPAALQCHHQLKRERERERGGVSCKEFTTRPFKVRMCLMDSNPSSHFTHLVLLKGRGWSRSSCLWATRQGDCQSIAVLSCKGLQSASPLCLWRWAETRESTCDPRFRVTKREDPTPPTNMQGSSWESNSSLCSCEIKVLSIASAHTTENSLSDGLCHVGHFLTSMVWARSVLLSHCLFMI